MNTINSVLNSYIFFININDQNKDRLGLSM